MPKAHHHSAPQPQLQHPTSLYHSQQIQQQQQQLQQQYQWGNNMNNINNNGTNREDSNNLAWQNLNNNALSNSGGTQQHVNLDSISYSNSDDSSPLGPDNFAPSTITSTGKRWSISLIYLLFHIYMNIYPSIHLLHKRNYQMKYRIWLYECDIYCIDIYMIEVRKDRKQQKRGR